LKFLTITVEFPAASVCRTTIVYAAPSFGTAFVVLQVVPVVKLLGVPTVVPVVTSVPA